MAVKIPSKLHTMSPTFQKAWYKRNKMELPTHLTGSVKQASKEVKPSERVKKLQTKSLQAYGATKGLKVGGEHGSGEMKDTIAPLTRDQHSKVQAAARAAKAAEKSAAKKTPLTKSQRMSAIAAAVRKAQTKHDVPTMEPDDEGHDDLRDLHQSFHIRKGYNEEVELDEASKAEAEKLLGGPVKTRTGNEPKGKLPLGFRRARNLARQAMKGGVSAIHRSMEKTMQKENVTESTTEVNEMSSHGKKLAKMIMAKQSKHPIAQMMGEAGDEPKHTADAGEYDYEGDMAKSQLKSIITNAQRLHDMLEDTTNLPEWVQSKITLAEDYVLTAANYMEGEMNEEVEQINELSPATYTSAAQKARGQGTAYAAKATTQAGAAMYGSQQGKHEPNSPAAKMHAFAQKRFNQAGKFEKKAGLKPGGAGIHSYDPTPGDKGYSKSGPKSLTREEVEQVDEKINLVKAKMGDVIKDFQKSDAPQFKGKSMEKRREMAIAAKLGAEREVKEEVEQIDEGDLSIRTLYNKWADHYTSSDGNSAKRADAVEKTITKVHGHEVMNHLKKAIKANLRNDMDQEENHFERARNAAEKSGSDRVNATVGKDRSKFRKEEVEQVTEAEGSVPTTPKEKELAKHHGDPKRITYGDVIKARLKSAAAKKMGK
jgi:hypothetical protein